MYLRRLLENKAVKQGAWPIRIRIMFNRVRPAVVQSKHPFTLDQARTAASFIAELTGHDVNIEQKGDDGCWRVVEYAQYGIHKTTQSIWCPSEPWVISNLIGLRR